MTSIFLDTNIFVRFFVNDNQQQHIDCVRIVEKISSGTFRPYTSNIVIMELFHVLIKLYKQPKIQILPKVARLITLRNMTLIEETNSRFAIQLFHQYNIKYGDCLIAAQVPKGMTLVTYDSDFRKIPSLIVATPDKIIPAK